MVPARTAEGLTLFDLPADSAGITRRARDMIDARDAAQITFENVEATGADVLGQVGRAMDVLKPALSAGQAALAAEMTGLSVGAFEMTTQYLKDSTLVPIVEDVNGTGSVVGKLVILPKTPVNPSGVDAGGYQVVPILCYHQFTRGSPRNRMD